jgi:hypothetical protein
MNTYRILIPIVIAQTSIADFKTKVEDVLNLIMIFGFVTGTIVIIGGARQINRGDYESGKMAILSGVIIASAPAIMRLLYAWFGFPDAAL